MRDRPAHFILRLVAFLVDFFIFLGLNVYFLEIAARSTNIPNLVNNLLLYLMIVAISPLGLLYQVLLTYWFGGTPGKLLTGLKVVSQDYGKLSFKRVSFRQTVGYLFSGLFFWLGYFAVLKDEKRQGWHDKAVGSLVVQTGNYWVIGVISLLGLVGSVGYFGAQAVQAALKNEPLKQEFIKLYADIQDSKIKSGLQVQSEPKAKVFIDEKEVGETPYEDKDIEDGEYKVRLSSESGDAVSWEGSVRVNKGTSTFVFRDLNKDVVAGEVITLETGKGIKITSNPSGATVEENEKVLGTTPLILEDASSGEHKYTLSKQGRLGRYITVNIVDNYQTHLAMDLGPDKGQAVSQVPVDTDTPEEIAESLKYWQGEIDYLNQQLGTLATWKAAGLSPARVDRMIQIANQQKEFANYGYGKTVRKERFSLEDGEKAKEYARLTEEFNKLAKEVYP